MIIPNKFKANWNKKKTGGPRTERLNRKWKTNQPAKKIKKFEGSESLKMFCFYQKSVSSVIEIRGIRQEVTLFVRSPSAANQGPSSCSWWRVGGTAASKAPLISFPLQVPPGNCITNYPILLQFPPALWENQTAAAAVYRHEWL